MLGAVIARMESLLCLFLSLAFSKFRADNFQNQHEEREIHPLNSPKVPLLTRLRGTADLAFLSRR